MPINQLLLNRLKMNDPTLTELNLKQAGLLHQDIQTLVQALAHNTSLTRLDLSANQIGDEGAIALGQHTSLAQLNLHNNQIRAKGAQALAQNTSLNQLNLNINQISTEGAKALALNTSLTQLYLYGNQIGDEGAKALAQNTSLTQLHLGHNQISVEGAKALAKNTSLTQLYLSNNQIGAQGAKALAKNTSLIQLSLNNNQIGAEGAKALAKNTSLTQLNLGDNQIGAEGAKAFAHNTSLTQLDLYGSQVRAKLINVLQQVCKENYKQNEHQVIQRRDQFIQSLITLGRDGAKTPSQSYWSWLPNDLKLHIIRFMDFRPPESIGKSATQRYQCAEFIFENNLHFKESLAESLKTKQEFKIMEKIVKGNSQFRFFPPKPQQTSSVEEAVEPVRKIQKTI